MDTYRIDSHKLLFHVPRVNDWLGKKIIYPIYMEISPSGACNHRCIYCALDFMEYRPRFLNTELLKERITEMASLGLRSIMFAGEGEPLLHKDIGDIIIHTKQAGVDVAITTNGILLKETLVDKALQYISWIKVSINGATKDTYGRTHQTNPDDFDRVIQNMTYAARVKKENRYPCTLGMQIVLLPENYSEVIPLAQKAKDIGMDYLVVKPYSQHPLSKTVKYKDIKYSDYLYLSDELNNLNDDKFSVIFRINTMKKWDDSTRNYRHCLALPFWSYMDSEGTIWGCSAYLTDEQFRYGNIYEKKFKEIWESEKRLNHVRWAGKDLSTDQCRVNCRMDEINRYLWELTNPHPHVNFI